MSVRMTTRSPGRATSPQTQLAELDLVVLGGGPAGVAAAERAAELGATVALVRPRPERATGATATCLLRSTVARLAASPERGGYGDAVRLRGGVRFDELRARAAQIATAQVVATDARLQRSGVSIIEGIATFEGAHALSVESEDGAMLVATDRTLVATGATGERPRGVDFDGRSVVGADELLAFRETPARLTIVGAGALGLELASLYAALGSRVFVVEQAARVPAFAERSVSDAMLAGLADQGIELRTSTRAIGVERGYDGTVTTLLEGLPSIASRGAIWATGLRAGTGRLGLERAAIATDPSGRIVVDQRFCTSRPDVFAAGGAVAGWIPAPESAQAGRAAASYALGSEPDDPFWPTARAIATVTGLASVGPTSDELDELDIPYVRGTSRAGELVVLVSPVTRLLLAAHAFGSDALGLVDLAQIAIRAGITVDELARAPFCHPELGEAYRLAAASHRLPGPRDVASTR
jgi:pyruvate/2-oxoglutarate dehydrogenase complex dihydrolipoamide dehydrogenase (E3) component